MGATKNNSKFEFEFLNIFSHKVYFCLHGSFDSFHLDLLQEDYE